MSKTITLYGEDATAYVELIHKYRLWEPRQEPEPWDAEKVARITKRLTDKQREAVLLLDGVNRREYMSSRHASHKGTWTLTHIGAEPEPMVYINGRVLRTLDQWGITRCWYESDKQTALSENGKAVLELLKESA